ncbi:RND superfamily putative drug exporter [Microbacterium endophyticum]|uniref:RND superfamily putative drug exporter n=1 Tax=Microbacterium endophyticum TaxID=1526412 RepID=A0A7W4V3A8_9MICO|nr:MMPL family transporter [Microbacterium endophyticum]MBB2976093.1 RND superfamily putative drug exporter [Microbacterium endophyticum]NIK34989.1 RND superfamily putative drug exporter [Microbacterium endophyticum]
MSSLLYRVGRFSAKYRWWVIVAWLVLAVGLGTIAGVRGGSSNLEPSFTIPGTQAQEALETLEQRFPQLSGASARVIVQASDGGDISDDADVVSTACEALASLSAVKSVTCPFPMAAAGSSAAGTGEATQVSSDKSMAFIALQLSSATASNAVVADAESAMQPASEAGLKVAYSGLEATASSTNFTELFGIAIAFLVLALTFGSLVAAGIPLLTALLGVGFASSAILITASFVPVSQTAPLLATMLGLAVGIDYSLLITSRHRAQMRAGMSPRQSVAVATATAGTAVVFAGITVMIALVGLSVAGIPFLTVMGLGAAVAVMGALAVALTLLPALLAVFGGALRPRVRRRQRTPRESRPPIWVRGVTATPIVAILLVVGCLGAAAIPAFGARLTLPDAGYDPPGSPARVAYDLLDEGFGPGFNGPLVVTADISHTLDIEKALDALDAEFAGVANVAAVSQATPNEAFDFAVLSVTPKSSPSSAATADLVATLRDLAPSFEKKNGFTFEVTGSTALGVDISARLNAALLPFGVVVVGLCLLLLTIMFRSIAVPLSATVGYLLTVGGALGVTRLVFEMGFGASLIGVAKVGPVVSFMPILVMAVLFGLAMDYHVFLVSRMREQFFETGSARTAVLQGFSASARVITAAALIMFSVFFSFVPGSAALIQPIAFALAIGVLIDAFIVRMTFIPAVMALLGDKAWWVPKWLDRALPNADIEGEVVQRMLRQREWVKDGGDQSASIWADGLSVVQSAPVSFRASEHDVVLVEGEHSGAVVAAIAGRAADTVGDLSVFGRLVPFERAAISKECRFVPAVPDAPGGETVHERLRARMRDAARASHERDALVAEAAETYDHLLNAVSDDAHSMIELSTPVGSLTDTQLWSLDVAAALAPSSRLVAIDATGKIAANALVAVMVSRARTDTTLVVAASVESPMTDRHVVMVALDEYAGTATKGHRA